MPILNDLSKKLSNVAQTTVQVSKDLAGSAKVTLAVSAEEREIEKAYRALGHWYYTTRGENPEEAGDYLDIIDTSLRKIREIRDEAEAAKTAAVQPASMVTCPACGAEMEEGTKFCPSCGAMMPDPDTIVREDVVCPNCGAVTNGPFCPQCGSRVQE